MLRASTNHAGPSSSVLQIVVARKLTKGSGPARRGGGGKAKFWGDRGEGEMAVRNCLSVRLGFAVALLRQKKRKRCACVGPRRAACSVTVGEYHARVCVVFRPRSRC